MIIEYVTVTFTPFSIAKHLEVRNAARPARKIDYRWKLFRLSAKHNICFLKYLFDIGSDGPLS